jgi:hypothetical protein
MGDLKGSVNLSVDRFRQISFHIPKHKTPPLWKTILSEHKFHQSSIDRTGILVKRGSGLGLLMARR